MTILRSLLCNWKSFHAAVIISGTPILSDSIQARTPQFPDTNVTRAKSPSGRLYVYGGIGLATQQAMERMAGPYNLKLVFTRRVGTPMTPDFVVIGDNHSRKLEKIFVRGPWFYIQLPSGAYTILARFDDRIVVIRDVFLGDEGRRTYWVRGD